jgi:CSLREA domain-containing protein
MIATFLVAVAMLVQAESTGAQRADAADTCTVSWNVDVSGNWSTPANWSLLAVPGPTDDVCIDRTAVDVAGTIDVPAVVNNLTSTDNIVLPSSSSLELAAVSEIVGNLTTAGGLTSADLTLSEITDWSGAVTNNGTIQIIASSGRSLTGSLLNDTGALVEQDPTLTLLDGATIINRRIWDFTRGGDLAAPAAPVLAQTQPTNDDFASATVLAERSGTLAGETTERATLEIGEPTHAGVAGTPARSVWYEWTPTWDGSATIDVDTPSAPDDWDSVGAVYTGSDLDALTEVVATSTVGINLHLEFDVVGGTNYRIVVDGLDSDNWGSLDLAWAYALYGGTWTVTKTEDTDDGACDSDCSLREAVVAANTTPGNDIIELPAGMYLLTLDWWGVADHFGSLDIASGAGTTSILGEGRDTTVIDATTLRTLGASNPDRVFTVGYGAGLELVGVTVTGGYTENALSAQRDGGGIWNWNGYLTVTDSLIEGNVAGVNGGGIANHYGTATITNTIIRDNNTDPPEYSTIGYGGGIYNSGTMTIVDSMIELNASDNGGGIANEEVLEDYPPTLDISNSEITNNSAWRGGGVANFQEGTMILSDSTVSDNNALRGSTSSNSTNRGGGIWNAFGGVLTITDTAIEGNQVMATHAVHPVDGSGGGIANLLATLNLSGTTVSGNTAICDQDITGDPDLCGRGGGIVNAGGEATIVNSTISGNTTALLNSEHSPYLGGGGGGGLAHMPYRSGMYVWCPITILDSDTITGNSADHGGAINTRWETKTGLLYDIDDWEVAPNVYECPFLYVTNTIVAGNTATFTAGTEDSWGDYTSEGYNLVGDGTGSPTDGIGDVTTADPLLGPLADNGGPTLTHLPLKGSPAIDAGSTDQTVDQRDVARPVGAADDIGAVEAPVYPNEPPVLDAIGDQLVAEADTLDVGITASDTDGDPLTFILSGEPVFAALVDHGDGTATLSLTPGFDDAGVYPGVTVTVSDSVDSDSETFTITVTEEEPIYLFLPLVIRSH